MAGQNGRCTNPCQLLDCFQFIAACSSLTAGLIRMQPGKHGVLHRPISLPAGLCSLKHDRTICMKQYHHRGDCCYLLSCLCRPACISSGHNSNVCCQDGAHGHQRQRQVQLPPDVLQQGGVAPELAEPDSVSFASGAGDAVLLTSTGDDDVIDAQATMHLPSTGMCEDILSFRSLHQCWCPYLELGQFCQLVPCCRACTIR